MEQELFLEQSSLGEPRPGSSGPHINQFPNEILDEIFAFLTLKDRKSVSLVCHRWNKLAFAPLYMREVLLNMVRYNYKESDFEVLKKSERIYKNIRCSKFSINHLLFLGPNLESVSCKDGLYKCQLRPILQCSPKLRELKVSLRQSDKIDNDTMPVMEQLTSLRLNANKWSIKGFEISEIFPKVTRMDICISCEGEYTTLLKVLPHFGPQLQCLQISGDFSLRGIPFNQMPFPQLESFILSDYSRESETEMEFDTFRNFFVQLTNLRSFDMIPPILDEYLQEITYNCKKLQELRINVNFLRDSAFASLAQLAHLKTLSIDGELHEDVLIQCSKPINTIRNLELRDLWGSLDLLPYVIPNAVNIILPIYADGLFELVSSFPNLKRLSISDVHGDFQTSDLEVFVSLEELILDIPRDFYEIFDRLPGNPSLKRLRIFYSGNSKIKKTLDNDILRLLQRLPALRFLELDLGFRITEDGFRRIRQEFNQCVIQQRIRKNSLLFAGGFYDRFYF
ncbi:F-box/LRR-repeat protein 7-like [Uranotaenia lowii]|uniref:F-box/LRR-repeat protein 7-like n=1 Tax=Uranotaenia lowii TaxID=190385 RepID=UPI00247844E9|nr:F-box/LRR-repeat protein 7-like [Uranotaenia lowii]